LVRAEKSGHPEAILRMLVLVERASGRTEGARLETINYMFQSKPPFGRMQRERGGEMMYQQSVIVELAGKTAVSTLPMLVKDDVDRIRALNVVYDLVGPAETMNAPGLAMFRHMQSTLRAMVRKWHDPEKA
jgi:hypothetical protein